MLNLWNSKPRTLLEAIQERIGEARHLEQTQPSRQNSRRQETKKQLEAENQQQVNERLMTLRF